MIGSMLGKWLLGGIFILGAVASSFAQNWQADVAASAITFTITNAGSEVDGQFHEFETQIQFDPAQPSTGSIDGKIAINSIKTGIAMRDRHLMKEDYFDEENHPYMTFKSTRIRKQEAGFVAEGTLTIKGTAKQVSLPFTFSNQTFEATLQIQREDFQIAEGSWFLGDEVKIRLVIPVKEASQ